jgi:hypothetical protein
MPNLLKISAILILFLFFSACSESPFVEFYSYHELMEYEFFSHGWFPEILKEDAFAIKETYDVGSRHAFGRFEFKQRELYEADLKTCLPVAPDLLLEEINKIERPAFPEWFVEKENIAKGQYLLVKSGDFYLIAEKITNRIYFFR